MSEQNNDTKGCVGCVLAIFILVAAAFYFGPDLREWNKKRNRTNAVDDGTTEAHDRVPEFLAARRLKGELLGKIRDALDFAPWDPPEGMTEPPPVGALAGQVILWQERRGKAPAKDPAPVEFRWQFDLEIDIRTKGIRGLPPTRRTLPHADEIRAGIEAELPPTLRLAPDSFTLIHQDPDVRPPYLTRVILPNNAPPLVRKLFRERGLADVEATLPEIRFIVVRTVISSTRAGRYSDGSSATRGALQATFFLVPSRACIGVHRVTWDPPLYKSRNRRINAVAGARSRFDTWLQKTHGFDKPTEKFLPEMLPPPVAKKKPVTNKRKRR